MAKSVRTKALEIPRSVKEAVHKRQKGRSIFAPYQMISVEECCCHYIPRSKGGLGIEENIFGCSQEQHRLFDNNVLKSPTSKRITNLTIQQMHSVARNHLIRSYGSSRNESKLIYKKFKGEEE